MDGDRALMLILPPGHAETVIGSRRLSRRERWMLRGVLAAVAAVVLAVVISLTSASPTSSHGCIHLTFPGPVGAQQINQCGSGARATCASARTRGAFTAQVAASLAAECRKAGLPVGP
jgi:hypothetical protein